jgi:phenazine biosynthesis protein phzE
MAHAEPLRGLGAGPGAFALLHRPHTDRHRVDILRGTAVHLDQVAELPDGEVLALVPYRQVRERGFACHDDGTPLVALIVDRHDHIPRRLALDALPRAVTPLRHGRFEPDDAAYADQVRAVVTGEIGRGEGSNFVLRRTFVADVADWSPDVALALFRRLLLLERGTYWTYLVHLGDRTLVGATPERHIGVHTGIADMSPISGTLRYPPGGPTLAGLTAFLADAKETDELSMVLDEELKMMARICTDGGRVAGPRLRRMAQLAHTEYAISGRTDLDVRDVLRESLLAPPVVGSPLENACRVIHRHETSGRGYYSGIAALLGRDRSGRPALDSAIVIRSADIDATGRVRIDCGATLVRHSCPAAEAAETAGKAATLLNAFNGATGRRPRGATRTALLSIHPRVQRLLKDRSARLSSFWLGHRPRGRPVAGLHVTIVDAEDMFTNMLAHQLTAIGAAARIRPWRDPPDVTGDVLVLGPGPGDPTDPADPKMTALRDWLATAAMGHQPVLGLCLGHQIIADFLGLTVEVRAEPNQGAQRVVDLFGTPQRVGFYNTFTARSSVDTVTVPDWGTVRLARDHVTGEVHALRAGRLGTFQFHPESVLTAAGPALLAAELLRLTAPVTTRTAVI